MIAYRSGGKQLLILRSKPACHILSNACETSKKTVVQYLPASISILIFLTILCICFRRAYVGIHNAD